MAQFVAGEESGWQVWDRKVIRNHICKGRADYPLVLFSLFGRVLINRRFARLMLEM
jgi:hypothetical protein